jgi:predicted nucleotidyltransferase
MIQFLCMSKTSSKRIERVRNLLADIKEKVASQEDVLALIIYGSFSGQSDHKPTEYSDIDLEIAVKDEKIEKYLENFRSWFEKNIEPVLIETSVGHIEKIIVTKDFVDLQFTITPFEDFDRIDKREINYFVNGYEIVFDRTGKLKNKIEKSLQLKETSLQNKFDKLNNKFWYFIQGITPYLKRSEYWYVASSLWHWSYEPLVSIIRLNFAKETEYNQHKHLERTMTKKVLDEIEPLRNMEKNDDIKNKLMLLIKLYKKYAKLYTQKNFLVYDENIERRVLARVKEFI